MPRRPGQLLAAAAGATQIVAAFLAWTSSGRAGLDVVGPLGLAIGISMVSLAALPLVVLLVSDRGWPRLVSGTGTAILVLAHLRSGPDGMATAGVMVATAAAITHWLAAALATGPVEVARLR